MLSLLILFILTLDGIQPTDCQDGNIRITGYNLPNKGRVEICRRRVWGSICQHSLGRSDRQVICRMLGYNGTGESRYISYIS